MWRGIFALTIVAGSSLANAGVRAVLVGCSYASSKTIPHLDCPANDVALFEQLLKARPENVVRLVSGSGTMPTKDAILDTLQSAEASCEHDDAFVFFFSGHGEPTRSGKTCLVPDGPMPVDFDPERDFITVSSIRAEIQHHCRARRALIFLDSCFSGGKGVQPTEPGGSGAGPEIIVFAAAGANQEAYESSDKYSVFTLALSQLVSEQGSSLSGDTDFKVDQFQSRLRDRVHELCRTHGQMLQDPVVFASPEAKMDVFTPSLSATTTEVIKKPLVGIEVLKRLKRGIGVMFKCDGTPKIAERVDSAIRQRLLECGYPVFGAERSRELASVIEKASTLEGQKVAADLTDRLLVTGEITYTGSNSSFGTAQYKSAILTITLQVMDLEGNHIIEYSSDLDQGPVSNIGATEDSAVSAAIKSLIDRTFTAIKPQLEVNITKRMPPIQDH